MSAHVGRALALLGVLVVVAPARAAAAQTPPPASPSPGSRAGNPPVPGDEAFRMVDAYVISNLQESLGLTDEQFIRVLPLVKRFHDDRRQLAQRRRRALMELRKRLMQGGVTEDQVAQGLRELKAAETEEPIGLRRDLDAIDATLTPLQQAKYRVLEAEVERKIRELIRQIRMQGDPRGRRAPNPQPQH